MTVIRATYSDVKLIKTRAGIWVAIAPITDEAATRTPPPAEKPRKRMGDMSRTAQAGMLCDSEEFQAFLDSRFTRREKTAKENAAAIVREQCRSLRRYLDTDVDAGKRWDQLRLDYDVWRGATAVPR